MSKKETRVHWSEYGDTDMPLQQAREIYNEANARRDRRACEAALQNIVRNEGRLCEKYAPVYWAWIVADRTARAAGAERPEHYKRGLADTGEYDIFHAAVARSE